MVGKNSDDLDLQLNKMLRIYYHVIYRQINTNACSIINFMVINNKENKIGGLSNFSIKRHSNQG